MARIEENKTVNIKDITGYSCDRCKKRYYIESDFYEIQEMTNIRNTCGYNSVFGMVKILISIFVNIA